MTKVDLALPEIIKSDIADIINNFSSSQFADNIIKIILFGSYVNNKYQPDSDIDIAVVVKNKPEKNQLADYYLIVDNIQREIDLLFCTEEQLLSGEYVYSEILREGLTIYENI
jgi:predicted nucleotidyltransferase